MKRALRAKHLLTANIIKATAATVDEPIVQATWSDAARAAALESRKKHGIEGVGFENTPEHFNKWASHHEGMVEHHSEQLRMQPTDNKEVEGHREALEMHDNAAMHYRKAADLLKIGAKKSADFHLQRAERYSIDAKSTEAPDNIIHCRAAAGVKLSASEPWVPGKPVSYIYAPGGVTTISAGFRKDESITVSIIVDESTAADLQASFDHVTATQKQEPYADEDHEGRKATLRFPSGAVKFTYGTHRGEEGVVVTGCEPTSYGAEAVNGKVYASWSPEFATDADYSAAKCRKGHWTFPDGVRGSASNPARMTGVNFVTGALTNKPAFKNMPNVKAKAVVPVEDTIQAAGTSEGVKKGWQTRKISGGGENAWSGTEHQHANGNVRVIDEDGQKAIHTLSPNGIIHWSATVHNTAPQALHDAALEHAKDYVENGMKNLKPNEAMVNNGKGGKVKVTIPATAADESDTVTAGDMATNADMVKAAEGAFSAGHPFYGNKYSKVATKATFQANVHKDMAHHMKAADAHFEAGRSHFDEAEKYPHGSEEKQAHMDAVKHHLDKVQKHTQHAADAGDGVQAADTTPADPAIKAADAVAAQLDIIYARAFGDKQIVDGIAARVPATATRAALETLYARMGTNGQTR